MVNIETLYNHIQELVKQDVDNILVDMIRYGTPVSGQTVTLNFQIIDGYYAHNGIGCFLCPTSATYSDEEDIRDNVLYSSLIPANPSVQTYDKDYDRYIFSRTDGFDLQFEFNDVAVGEYYIIVAGYDDNNKPLFSGTWQGENNGLGELGTTSDGEFDWNIGLPYNQQENPCHKITVVDGTNVWYGNSYY